MRQSLLNYMNHMLIIQRIINDLPFFSIFHKPPLFQNPQLMRNCRLSHPQGNRYITYTHFRLIQRTQYFYPSCIPQNFKKISQIIQNLFLWLFFRYHFNSILMNRFYFTYRYFFHSLSFQKSNFIKLSHSLKYILIK